MICEDDRARTEGDKEPMGDKASKYIIWQMISVV